MKIDGYEIELDNKRKVLFPEINFTKEELINYYQKISDTMLPHIKDRAITMHRFPDGIARKGFYQKEAPNYFPKWIDLVEIDLKEENKMQKQITCQNVATLFFLADQACITPHIWLSKVNKINKPDKLIFDLDPPRGDFKLVVDAAKDL